MLCIYHVADSDGKGSGAIVRTVYPGIELMGLNHDMEIPYDEIRKHEKVVVCDFALPVDFMFELNEKIDFTWIDHHASVINEYNEKLASGKYKEIKGLRRIGTAAIVLSWEYYYPDKPVPEGVILLGKTMFLICVTTESVRLNMLFRPTASMRRPMKYGTSCLTDV